MLVSASMPGLDKARVALLYSPANVGVDFAGALVRGLERGLLELGARVSTLNFVLGKHYLLPPDSYYRGDSPLVGMMIDFLRQEAGAAGFDLCLGMFHDLYLPPELREALRSTCRRVVNYPLNLLDQAHRFEQCIEFCDETFCAEEAAVVPLQERFGTNKVRYVPLASDPYIHRPVGSPTTPRVLFVGSIYVDRLSVLERCARELPVSIYSANYDVRSVLRNLASELLKAGRWPGVLPALRIVGRVALRDRRLVSDEEFVRLASTHGISVGLANVTHELTRAALRKVRLRDYEAPMCGLCHIAQRLPELQRGFVEGEEMLFYDDAAELPDLLARIRQDALAWREIGRKARRRAQAEHTWTKRLGVAFA